MNTTEGTKEQDMGLAHSCPDGKHSKLIRTGPIGTMEGVTYHCPRCKYTNEAPAMWRKLQEVRPLIVAALTDR